MKFSEIVLLNNMNENTFLLFFPFPTYCSFKIFIAFRNKQPGKIYDSTKSNKTKYSYIGFKENRS